MFDVNNFVINRPLRAVMLHSSTSEVLWSINQIEEPSLTMSSETQDAVDALGTPIIQFDRSKSAEFSAQNSLFDLGLLAAQSGTEKEISSADTKIKTPIFEEITIPAEGATVTLSKTPVGVGAAGIPYIYKLNGDSTLAQKFAFNASPGADTFNFNGTTLTYPTSLKAGDRILAIYDYEADDTAKNGAVSVMNTANDFPKAGRFIMEVLGWDVCDASTLYYAYIIFPQAKLSSSVDLTFTTEGKHPFTITAMQEYCDPDKKLFQIIVPEA